MEQILKALNEGLDRKYIKENKDYDDELTLSSDDLFMGDYDDYLGDEDYRYDDWDYNELSYPAKYPSRMNDFIIDDVDECLQEGARGQAIGTAIGGYFGHPALGGEAGSALEDKALAYARSKFDKFKLDNGIKDDEEAYREIAKRAGKKAAEVGTRVGKKIGDKITSAGSKLPKFKKNQPVVATESISNNITKLKFIKAYEWAYGATEAEARKAFMTFDNKAKQEIIKSFEQNAKKSFLSDGLHRGSSKKRKLKEGFVKLNNEPIEITYVDSENGDSVPAFDWDGETYYLDNFIRCHNNPWGEIDCPDYIHAYDSTNYYNPIFIGLDDSGDYVDVYEQSKMDESCKRKRKLKEGFNGIDLGKFAKKFSDWYTRLYNDRDLDDDNRDKAYLFDDMLKSDPEFKQFVSDFAGYRQDYISSDREASAFMLALKDLGAINLSEGCHKIKKKKGLKEARNTGRKKVTQKYLKDLIKSGKAENLNTWTDEQLKELQKKHYETIAVSFGINGMNGILLQDDDGKLYAVPSRSTTMFQMHKL